MKLLEFFWAMLVLAGMCGLLRLTYGDLIHCRKPTKRFYGQNKDGRIVSIDRRCRCCGKVFGGMCIAPIGVECDHEEHLPI